jgi:microcystin-dependent protein
VRTIAGGSLKYGTTYYVGIKARDPDGTAAMGTVVSGVLKPADAVDLNANSVTALQILAGTITADKLSSNFVLGKKMVASSFGTDPLTGWSAHNRVEIDGTAGVSLVLDDGTTEVYPVRLPLDGTPAQFSGGVSASDLTVSGAMVLNGQVSSSPPDISQISPGAALSLQGSIQNPNAAPSATATWAPQRQASDADTNYRYRGCDYSTTGGAAGTSQVYYVCRRDLVAGTWQLIEFLASTMVVNRVSTYYFGPDNEAELLDVCHVGTKVYVLVHLLQIPGQSEHWDVTVFDTTAFNTQVTTTTLAGARVNNKQPGLLYDGTNVGILSTNTTGGASRLKLGKLDNTTLAFVSDTLFDTAVTVSAPNTELYGGSRATNAGQSNTYVLGINDSTQSPSRYHNYTFDGTGLEIVSSRWDNPDADGASYVTYDTTNGRFVSMKESGLGAMWRHTDAFAYAANTNNVWFGYTFYDSNATGSQHETVVSTKVVGIQWTRRAYVNVTWPTPPILVGTDGVDNTRCYAVQSASSPVSRLRSAWQLQATVANPGTGLTLSAMAATAGTDTLGAFPSSNPGQITHQAGGSVAPLQGTGDGFLPVGMVVPFAGTVAPVGWLICDGAAVSRTGATANLFTVCGIAFGAGDGSTTFNIPDLKSRVPMGAGTFRARAANEGIAEASRDPGHTHGVGTIAIAQSGGSWANANISAGGALNGQGHAHANSAFSGATGAGGGTANFPSLGMNYIIKT